MTLRKTATVISIIVTMFRFLISAPISHAQQLTEATVKNSVTPLIGSVHTDDLSPSAKQLAECLRIQSDLENLRTVPGEGLGLAGQIAQARMESRINKKLLAAYFELNDATDKISEEISTLHNARQLLQSKHGKYGQIATSVASIGSRAAGLAGGMSSPTAMSGAVVGMIAGGVSSANALRVKKTESVKLTTSDAAAPSMLAPLFPFSGTQPKRYAPYILLYLNSATDGNKETRREELIDKWEISSSKDTKAPSTEEWLRLLSLKVPLQTLTLAELSKREQMLGDLLSVLGHIQGDLRTLSESF
jgi:hypothetical protein